MRYGYHLVTDCLKANQGKKPHKDVEATIIHYFNTYTNITATKPKPFPDGTRAQTPLPPRARACQQPPRRTSRCCCC